MILVGARGQQDVTHLYDFSGTIASATVPQLLLPAMKSRAAFYFANNSSHAMWIEFGSAQATCTISSGVVNAITITNPGFGFLKPPSVTFYGGGNIGQPGFLGAGVIGSPNVAHSAVALATVTAGTISALTITNGGSGYLIAPQVVINNDPMDAIGCADPSQNGGVGFPIQAAGTFGSTLYFESTLCPTQQCAVFCGTATARFSLKFHE